MDEKDMVLGFCLDTIATEQKQSEGERILAMIAKIKIDKKTGKVAGSPKAPKKEKPIVVPFVATLDAVAFLALLHDAAIMDGPNGSKIPRPIGNHNGKPCKSDEQQALEVAALKGYCDYSKSAPHGTQLDVAVRRARASIRPDLLRDKPKSDPTLKGFVAGAADHGAKGIANLLARETLAVSRMAQCDAIANMHGGKDASDAWHKFLCALDPNKDPAFIAKVDDGTARKLAAGYSSLENERLDPIREELKAAGHHGKYASAPLTSRIQVSWKDESPSEENVSE